MNTYLLGLISKWITIITISVTGILNSENQQTITIENQNQTKNTSTTIKEIDYPTEKIYNDKIPNNITKTKQKGKKGTIYKNENNFEETLTNPVTEIIEIGTGEYGEYNGKLTGYGADCQGCTGILSCPLKNGQYYNLSKQGEIYKDEEYGEIRILAAALQKFPCGTIIQVTIKEKTFNAIVLDTGSTMQKAWEKGIIHMDLAHQTENQSQIRQITSDNVKYSVQRWGW